jgi:hypothetical protein
VAVAGLVPQQGLIADLLRRFLADEEVPVAADNLDQVLVQLVVRWQRLDVVQQLVVAERQPAAFGRPLAPRRAARLAIGLLQGSTSRG